LGPRSEGRFGEVRLFTEGGAIENGCVTECGSIEVGGAAEDRESEVGTVTKVRAGEVGPATEGRAAEIGLVTKSRASETRTAWRETSIAYRIVAPPLAPRKIRFIPEFEPLRATARASA
jgi:hypothetical protein